MGEPHSLIHFNNLIHARALAKEAGTVFNFECDQCISRSVDGVLVGGVVFSGYTGASIHVHFAGFTKNWATRDMIWVIFDYAFNQLGCSRIFGQVPESNTRALEIDQRLGFKIVTKIGGVFPDGACYLLAMDRDDCRWLKHKPRMFKLRQET